MAKFKSKEELGGEIDPRINTKGNPNFGKGYVAPKATTNRQLREREFMGLLRKIKPHQADAIMTAVRIMKNPEAADANKLKSAALIISLYRELVADVYDQSYDNEDSEVGEVQQQQTALFSLKVVNGTNQEVEWYQYEQ